MARIQLYFLVINVSLGIAFSIVLIILASGASDDEKEHRLAIRYILAIHWTMADLSSIWFVQIIYV